MINLTLRYITLLPGLFICSCVLFSAEAVLSLSLSLLKLFSNKFLTLAIFITTCSAVQANTIEHEERYYRRVRPGLQTATQTRLDMQQQQQQQPSRSLLRPMKHSNSDGMLLLRHQSTDLRQTSLADCRQSRQQLTTSFPSTNTQLDHAVRAFITAAVILFIRRGIRLVRGVDPYGTGGTVPPNIWTGETLSRMSPSIFLE